MDLSCRKIAIALFDPIRGGFERNRREDEPDDAVFRAAAKIPAEWMGVGIVREGPPFDVNEFLRFCGEETETV
jgi:hypothetical protein